MRLNSIDLLAVSVYSSDMQFALTQLKRLREWRGLTQGELSEASGVKLSSIQKQERGVQEDALLSNAVQLAKTLEVPVEALFTAAITDKCINPTPQEEPS